MKQPVLLRLMQPRPAFYRLLLLPLILLVLLCSAAMAQQSTVTFRIINSKNQPVSFASVTVVAMPDSVNIQQKVADTLGHVKFTLVQNGQYFVSVTAVNYEPVEKRITV